MIQTVIDILNFDYKVMSDWFSKISASFLVGAFLTVDEWKASCLCIIFSIYCLYFCQKTARYAKMKEKRQC
jgi:hypothetical protein